MLPEITVIAYTAGFVDGEGCIGHYGRYGFNIRVSQSEINYGGEILARLRADWGGIGTIHKYKKRFDNQKHFIYEWSVGGAWQVETLLGAIAPYLRVKRERGLQVLQAVRHHIATRRCQFSPAQRAIIREG
jgi:hypothetical protein